MDKSELKKEVSKQTVGYVVAALGLVAGLAWNDAIKALIDFLFPLNENGIWAKFIYAGAVTIAVVLISTWLVRFVNRGEKN